MTASVELVGAATTPASETPVVITVTDGAPKGGELLVVTAADNAEAGLPVPTVTDSKGNTWTRQAFRSRGVGVKDGLVAAVFTTRLDTALTGGDTITTGLSMDPDPEPEPEPGEPTQPPTITSVSVGAGSALVAHTLTAGAQGYRYDVVRRIPQAVEDSLTGGVRPGTWEQVAPGVVSSSAGLHLPVTQRVGALGSTVKGPTTTLVGHQITVRVAQGAPQGGGSRTWELCWLASDDGANRVGFVWNHAEFSVRLRVNNVDTWLLSPWGAQNSNQQWARLHHDGTTLRVQTSPDGETWTTVATPTLPAGFNLTDGRYCLDGEYWGTEPAAEVVFADFAYAPVDQATAGVGWGRTGDYPAPPAQITNLPGGVQHHVRVAADLGSGEWSPWSEWATFTPTATGGGEDGSAEARRGVGHIIEWPFRSDSCWNTPIGSGATYGNPPAAFTSHGLNINVDGWTHPTFIAEPSDQITGFYENPSRAQIDGRMNGATLITQMRAPRTAAPDPAPGNPYSGPGDAHLYVTERNPAGGKHLMVECWSTVKYKGNQPAGGGSYNRLSTDFDRFVARRVEVTDLWGRGMGEGAEAGVRASGMSGLGGLVQRWMLDQGRIPIALALALDVRALAPTFVYPSSEAESNGQNPSGLPMGALLAIPPSVTAPSGMPAGVKLLFDALQNYGCYISDGVGTNGHRFYFEPRCTGHPYITQIRSSGAPGGITWLNWLRNQLRRVTNNATSPTSGTLGGPGTRRVSPAPLLPVEDPTGGDPDPGGGDPGPGEPAGAQDGNTGGLAWWWDANNFVASDSAQVIEQESTGAAISIVSPSKKLGGNNAVRIECVGPRDNGVAGSGTYGKRTEVRFQGAALSPTVGQTHVHGFLVRVEQLLLPPQGDKTFLTLAQFHGGGSSGSPVWALEFNWQGALAMLRRGGTKESPSQGSRVVFQPGEFQIGRTYAFMVETRWATSGTGGGYHKLWVDGVTKADWELHGPTRYIESGPYWKSGFYGSQRDGVCVALYDNFCRATGSGARAAVAKKLGVALA